jgi:kynurenine 3-monooxygenase
MKITSIYSPWSIYWLANPASPKFLMSGAQDSKTRFHIVGGGPVGLAAALLLAKAGYSSVVYESRNEIPHNVEESYPIGINPRALHTMEQINPSLADEARNTGRIVDAWQIFAGPRMVADLRSGVVYGTSRGKVTRGR